MALELGFRLPCEVIHPNAYDFVNDLPGVTFKKMSDIADSDLELAKNLFYKCEKAAERMVVNDFLLMLGKTKRLLSVTDMTYRNMVGTDTSGTGFIAFNKCNLSPYIKVKINSLIVKFTEDQTITIKVTDTGAEVETEHSVTAGINHIPINYEFKSEAGRVEFTAENWQTGPYSNSYGCSCRSKCNNYDMDYNVGFNIMSVVDQDAIIDMYAKQLSYPHKLAWFICFMQEIITTDRINYICDLSKEQVDLLWSTYAANTRPAGNTPGEYGLYSTALYNLVKGVEDSFKINEVTECGDSTILLIQSI